MMLSLGARGKFMRRVGSIRHEPASWKDVFLPEIRRAERELRSYAPPINIPTASTMLPPSTIWNAACRNGVSM